jgi:predicted ATP-grasp superfamily ATP-dependent carboligase
VSGPIVVATGGENPGGLALLRGLRAGGYRPVAAVVRGDGAAQWSRAPVARVRVADPLLDMRAHAEGVVRGASSAGATMVLPGSEASLIALSTHRDLFPSATDVAVPDLQVVRHATDKLALTELALSAGLAIPPTRVVRSAGDFDGPFPAIVKPVRSVIAAPEGHHDQHVVRIVQDREELAAALDRGMEAIVQAFLPGRLRTVNGVAWEGRIVCSIHQRSDRTWPLEAGVFAYGRTVASDPELEEGCARLIAEVGWSGIFNLQFLEAAQGEPLLIDLNPRAYHSLALANAAGANLAAVWADLALRRPPRAVSPQVGVRFRSEIEDIRAMHATFRAGQLRTTLGAAVPRSGTAHALFERRDPGPLLHGLRVAAGRGLRAAAVSRRDRTDGEGSARTPHSTAGPGTSR